MHMVWCTTYTCGIVKRYLVEVARQYRHIDITTLWLMKSDTHARCHISNCCPLFCGIENESRQKSYSYWVHFKDLSAYFISSKALRALRSSSFITSSSRTREYFLVSFRTMNMISSTDTLPILPTSIAFFVCNTGQRTSFLAQGDCSKTPNHNMHSMDTISG